jgi:hypothetical protein
VAAFAAVELAEDPSPVVGVVAVVEQVDGPGGPSEPRDRAGERREVAGVASQCAHELGLQLEHLELRHKQLVIVRPHREVLHARPAAAFALIGFADRVLSRAADTVWLSMGPRDHPTIG